MKTINSFVDVNAWLGPWPFQYFHDDSARLLEEVHGARADLVIVRLPQRAAAAGPEFLHGENNLLKR